MQQIIMPDGLAISRIGYAEKPLRADPALSDEPLLFSPKERAAIVEEAIASGINFLLATHERDALSLGESMERLECRNAVVLAATDGDLLNRCDDTEQDAVRAIETAISRKLKLLKTDRLDIFLLYDFRTDIHTEARLAGAVRALAAAQEDGVIRAYGATCHADYPALTRSLESDWFSPQIVIARMNALDQNAATSLIPVCASRQIVFFAAQPYAWVGGVPFPRFPNAWRLRNMTMNFFGQTVGQAHLRWLLAQPGVSGAMISMNEPGQPKENALAFRDGTLPAPPNSVESLFISFREAMIETEEGWNGLRDDPLWEIRQAAADYLRGLRQQVP